MYLSVGANEGAAGQIHAVPLRRHHGRLQLREVLRRLLLPLLELLDLRLGPLEGLVRGVDHHVRLVAVLPELLVHALDDHLEVRFGLLHRLHEVAGDAGELPLEILARGLDDLLEPREGLGEVVVPHHGLLVEVVQALRMLVQHLLDVLPHLDVELVLGVELADDALHLLGVPNSHLRGLKVLIIDTLTFGPGHRRRRRVLGPRARGRVCWPLSCTLSRTFHGSARGKR